MPTRTYRNVVFDAAGNLLRESVEEVDVTVEVNREAIEQAVRSQMDDLRTIVNSSGTLTGAQLSVAVRVLAKGQLKIIRLLTGAFDETD